LPRACCSLRISPLHFALSSRFLAVITKLATTSTLIA
jgi:hypothetical protein